MARRGVPRSSGKGLFDSGRSQTPEIGAPMRRHADPYAQAARPPPRIANRPGVLFCTRMTMTRKGAASGEQRAGIAACSLLAARGSLLLILTAGALFAAPPSTCGGTDDYSKALCAYQKRDFASAEAGFRGIV